MVVEGWHNVDKHFVEVLFSLPDYLQEGFGPLEYSDELAILQAWLGLNTKSHKATIRHSTLIEAGGGGAHHENVDKYKEMNIEKNEEDKEMDKGFDQEVNKTLDKKLPKVVYEGVDNNT